MSSIPKVVALTRGQPSPFDSVHAIGHSCISPVDITAEGLDDLLKLLGESQGCLLQ